MVTIGTLGTVLAAIDLLREVLEKSGVDRPKATQIAAEFMSKLRGKGAVSETAGSTSDAAAAFAEESWEYSVVTLSYRKPFRGTKSLAVELRDGTEVAKGEPPELAAYLNQAADDGWELLTTVGGEEAPTLILRREKHQRRL